MVLNGDVDDDIPTLCMKKVRLDTFAPFLVSPYPAMPPLIVDVTNGDVTENDLFLLHVAYCHDLSVDCAQSPYPAGVVLI